MAMPECLKSAATGGAGGAAAGGRTGPKTGSAQEWLKKVERVSSGKL